MTASQPGLIQAVGGPCPLAKPAGVPRVLAAVIRNEFCPLSPKSFEQDDPFGPQPAMFRKSLEIREERRTQSKARNRVRHFFLVAGALVAATVLLLLIFFASVVFFDRDTEPPHTVNDETTALNTDNSSLSDDEGKSRRESGVTISDDLGSICSDLTCSATVSSLRSQLDFRHDPCWNLYDHVCSRWQIAHCDTAAERGGSYSVDDAVLDRYAQALGSFLISEKAHSLFALDERQFLVECLGGKLPDAGEVEHILRADVPENATSTPEETLAEAIVRTARVGISPFFDVSVELSGDVILINLSRPQVTGNYVFGMAESGAASLAPQPASLQDTEASHAKSASELLFFEALQRQLCLAIAAVVRGNKSCRVNPGSTITPAWNYTWYLTEGLRTLRRSVALVLEPLAAGSDTGVNGYTSATILPVTKRAQRMGSCIHIIDRYVPSWFYRLTKSLFPAKFKNHANERLRILKKLIANEMPSARNIKMIVLPAPLTKTQITAFPSHVPTYDTFSKCARLETYLKNWTWKRWTQRPNEYIPAFSSTTSTFLKASQTLHVPPGAFNWSNTDSSLVRYLDLSRAGPRVLGTLFAERLSEEFKDSGLVRCLASHINEVQDLPEEIRESLLANLEEVASFYFSLAAYRFHVATALAFSPVSRMMTDALFLLYYVFNNCDALCEPDGSASPSTSRQRKVESVATMFSSALLQQCYHLPNVLSTCGHSNVNLAE